MIFSVADPAVDTGQPVEMQDDKMSVDSRKGAPQALVRAAQRPLRVESYTAALTIETVVRNWRRVCAIGIGILSFEPTPSEAIVLLEDGCQDFSNIHGLGHIPFPRGKIAASFEEIRQMLEREGLLPRAGQP